MQLERIIHPIGQGSFITESFFSIPQWDDNKGDKINVIFDCGSGSNKRAPAILKKAINGLYDKSDTIDLLFISHLHSDHINGIPYLKTKKKAIVIPYLTTLRKWLIFFESGLELFTSEQRLSYFKTNKLFFVKKFKEGDEKSDKEIEISDTSSEWNPNIRSEPYEEVIIDSGTRFINDKIPTWEYIPYNFDFENRENIFYKYLAAENILKAVIDDNLTEIFKDATLLKNLKQCYIKTLKEMNQQKKVNLNDSSMVVYSGPHISFRGSYRCTTKSLMSTLEYKTPHYPSSKVSALYTGDIDLNKEYLNSKNIIELLNDSLKESPRKPHGYSIDRISNIGLLQLPHHGSDKNFNPDLLSHFPNALCFVCYGSRNNYHHPGNHVIDAFKLTGRPLYQVNELSVSRLTQYIY